MKSSVYFLFVILILFTACKSNPVDNEAKIVSVEWKSLYNNTKSVTLNGDSNGNSFYLGSMEVSDYPIIHVRINYRSIYNRYFLSPALSLSDSKNFFYLSAPLKSENYNTLDTIVNIKGGQHNCSLYITLKDAKVIYDTLQVMAGREL